MQMDRVRYILPYETRRGKKKNRVLRIWYRTANNLLAVVRDFGINLIFFIESYRFAWIRGVLYPTAIPTLNFINLSLKLAILFRYASVKFVNVNRCKNTSTYDFFFFRPYKRLRRYGVVAIADPGSFPPPSPRT